MKTMGVLVLVGTFVMGPTAHAAIEEWGGAQSGYTIDPDQLTITITASGGYKFDNIVGQGVGNINEITIDPSVTSGDVHIWIAHRNGGPGAADFRTCNLSSSAITFIHEFRIEGDLGEDGATISDYLYGPFHVGGDVLNDVEVTALNACHFQCARLLGDFSVTAQQAHTGAIVILDQTATYTGDISVAGDLLPVPNDGRGVVIRGSLAGNVEIDGDCAYVRVGHDFSGYIHITGDLAAATTSSSTLCANGQFSSSGRFDVGGDVGSKTVSDYLTIGHAGAPVAGAVAIGGTLYGETYLPGGLTGAFYLDEVDTPSLVWLDGPVEGTVTIDSLYGTLQHETGDDDFAAALEIGSVENDGSVELQSGDLTGTIVVTGNVGGDILVTALNDTAEDTSSGHIIVNGSLRSTGAITVAAPFAGATEYVCIDYDGWDDVDLWVSGGTVTVDEDEYSENTPAALVWEVRPCKGDMNNDGSVDLFDIDPFVDVVTSGAAPSSQYSQDFPGLSGSGIYHGDMDCDNDVDTFDIDPFGYRLSNRYYYWSQWSGCDPCQQELLIGGGGAQETIGGGDNPYQFAAAVAAAVDSSNVAAFAAAAGELAKSLEDEDRAAYWAAVADALD